MVETIRPGASAPEAKIAVFDFDGTLSLIRAGWVDIMVPMMLEILSALNTGESEAELRAVVEPSVWRLTGNDTLYQMVALAEEIKARGGTPLSAQAYKDEFLARLYAISGERMERLRSRTSLPDEYLVPGSRAMLEELRGRGISLCLASGTDDANLKQEAELLDIARYFDGGIFGAQPDPRAFSKRMLFERLAVTPGIGASRVIGFGDGPVEIEELKRVGSLAVGLATDEPECRVASPWKRRNLIAIGADYIVPNYHCRADLVTTVLASHERM
jgi:phosphoglycolate phosphatase-like HAD superfamily hydrolase